ncbi:hypothetical protein NQ315_001045 [Exocentrus adspersus]|uniref:Uncharacterized protein n=1 Tax=Exocentrus adspersus TaxID=1586481 RepID=A0AAV8WE84_9CUCU|nr:hypothetical protein NQ315_001045 [Exocentrus adspersus]
MKILYTVLFIVFRYVLATDEELQLWEKYKATYHKSYKTPAEENQRFKIFQNNLKQINRHNEKHQKGLASYEMGVNKFADLTVDEFLDKYRYKTYPTEIRIFNDTLPKANEIDSSEEDYLDWREKGAVTPVKNQGTCGSCWIFSAIGVLESYYFRKYNKLIPFSEQAIVDCIANNSCLGGWPPLVFNHVKQHGVVKEEEYRYEEKQGQCRQNQFQPIKIPFKSFVQIQDNEADLKQAVTRHGPALVCLYANYKWMFYKKGVWYEEECSYYANHAVVLVGYGRERGQDYWILKNTLGKDWGEDGYMKMARNKHYNYCGITATSYYVK